MQEWGIGAGLAAMGFWLFIAVAAGFGIWEGARKRETQHETLRRLLESGQKIDDEMIDKVLGTSGDLRRDLRVGAIITLAVAPGLLILGYAVSLVAAEALMPLVGVAGLVFCAGVGLWLAADHVGRSDPTRSGTPRYRG